VPGVPGVPAAPGVPAVPLVPAAPVTPLGPDLPAMFQCTRDSPWWQGTSGPIRRAAPVALLKQAQISPGVKAARARVAAAA